MDSENCGLSALNDDAQRRARYLAFRVGLPLLPVLLSARVHHLDPPVSTIYKIRGLAGRPVAVTVDPDVYARLDGRARDALLGVELGKAAERPQDLLTAVLDISMDRFDLFLRRSQGWWAYGLMAMAVAAPLVGAQIWTPLVVIVGLWCALVVFLAMSPVYWLIKRDRCLNADDDIAALIGADAVRYVLMDLAADEPGPTGISAWRNRWLSGYPSVDKRLSALDRRHPQRCVSNLDPTLPQART